MKNFFQIGVKRCYSVTKLNYIVISTLLEQILVTPKGVTRCYKCYKIPRPFKNIIWK